VIHSLARAADRVWFRDAPPERLALLRILVGVWSLGYIGHRRKMLRRIARTTDPALFRPVGPLRVLDRPPSPEAVDALIRLNQAANIAFLLGWRHSRTGPVYAMSLLWLLSYLNSWSMIYHSNNLLAMHALALGASPAADAFSLDSRRTPPPSEHWRYGAPIQLINAVTTSSYFLAGMAKLKGPLGWRWATGEALRSQVAVDGIRKEVLGDKAGVLARWMYPKLGLYRLLAIGSLAAELGAPVALVRRSVGRLWGLNTLGMHWGIYLVMGIKFRYQQAGLPFAPFFPLERALVRRRRG
jgi:hypothetical protein